MAFKLVFTREAAETMTKLAETQHTAKKLRKVRKALGLLEQDPKYPGLQSHPYTSMSGANGEKIWDSYVENRTPQAWRIFGHYGPGEGTITVVLITPHP